MTGILLTMVRACSIKEEISPNPNTKRNKK
jgi:hypothetical protein